MDDALEQYVLTLARLISLGTPNIPVTFANGQYGIEISIGKEKFCGGGHVIMPMELIDAYAHLKMALEVNKAKDPFKF